MSQEERGGEGGAGGGGKDGGKWDARGKAIYESLNEDLEAADEGAGAAKRRKMRKPTPWTSEDAEPNTPDTPQLYRPTTSADFRYQSIRFPSTPLQLDESPSMASMPKTLAIEANSTPSSIPLISDQRPLATPVRPGTRSRLSATRAPDAEEKEDEEDEEQQQQQQTRAPDAEEKEDEEDEEQQKQQQQQQ